MSAIKVSSEALLELQNSLLCLAENLDDIGYLMSADLGNLHDCWRDGKFEEFEANFYPNIEKCREISSRYLDWNRKVLLPLIEQVAKIEQSEVGAPDTVGVLAAAGAESVGNANGGTPFATRDHNNQSNPAIAETLSGFNMDDSKLLSSDVSIFSGQKCSNELNIDGTNMESPHKMTTEETIAALNAANQKLKRRILSKDPIETPQQASKALDNINKVNKWFDHPITIIEINNLASIGRNGSTDRKGTIWLSKKHAVNCIRALENIRSGKECTEDEEISMATLWHELTHNMHRGDESPGSQFSQSRQYMELANEFVARNTFDRFFKDLGGELKHRELMVNRENTGYNPWVVKYQKAIEEYGLNKEKVVESVSHYLLNNDYASQDIGLAKALSDNSNGKLNYKEAEKLVRNCIRY